MDKTHAGQDGNRKPLRFLDFFLFERRDVVAAAHQEAAFSTCVGEDGHIGPYDQYDEVEESEASVTDDPYRRLSPPLSEIPRRLRGSVVKVASLRRMFYLYRLPTRRGRLL